MAAIAAAFTESRTQPVQTRLDWIDNSKTILIFLVVLGHFGYAPLVGRNLIYSFHVPAFLVVTGFLLPGDFGSAGPRRLWQKWLGPYVRAYAFFSAVAIFLWWVSTSLSDGQVANPWRAILGALTGISGKDHWLVHDDRPLWYFTFLATAMSVAWICAFVGRRTSPVLGVALALAYASFAVVYHGSRLPWCLDIAGMGTVLILAGYGLRHHAGWVNHTLSSKARAAMLLPVFGVLLVGLSSVNGSVNINRAEFGNSGVLFLPVALCGTATVVLFSALIPATSLSRRISANTLTIFALHIYLVRAADALPAPNSRMLQQAIMAGLAALIVLACLPVARLLQPILRRWVDARPVGHGAPLLR